MSEQLEQWAERMQRGLAQLDRRTRETLEQRARRVGDAIRAASPRRTGNLADSWRVRRSGDQMTVDSTHPAAAVLDRGGTLYGHPWLAVPLRASVGGRTPRQDGDLISIRTRDGRVYLAARRGRSLDFRWRLVRSIRLRARPYLRQSVADGLKGWDRQLLEVIGREVGPGVP